MRSRDRSNRSALEDQSEAERGGCDRRSFYARCPCVGMQAMEWYGTSLLLHACYSLSMCVLHTSFLLDLPLQRLACALACKRACGRWPWLVGSQRVAEPCSASTSIHIHRASVTRLSLCRRVAAESARSHMVSRPVSFDTALCSGTRLRVTLAAGARCVTAM